jgi:hypothetical protein
MIKYCNICEKDGHDIETCLDNEKWWLKEKKYLNRPVYLDSLPRHFVFSLQESIPNIFIVPNTYYVNNQQRSYYIWDYTTTPYIGGKKMVPSSYEWVYCIMGFVGSRDNDGKYYQLILDIEDDTYYDRYLLSVVRLINNPRIMYFILNYFPFILQQKILIRSSWKDRYSDDALLLQFVTNKKCYKMMYNNTYIRNI